MLASPPAGISSWVCRKAVSVGMVAKKSRWIAQIPFCARLRCRNLVSALKTPEGMVEIRLFWSSIYWRSVRRVA